MPLLTGTGIALRFQRQWDVSEKGAEEPLASFHNKEDAYAYATELTKAKPGLTVLIEEEEGFSPLPVQNTGHIASDEARHPGDGAGQRR